MSKSNWQQEKSATGRSGHRCYTCYSWVYDGQPLVCDCSAHEFIPKDDDAEPMTYHDVIHFKHTSYVTHIAKAQDFAQLLNYPYFMWNDCVYDTRLGQRTGLTAEDLLDIIKQ